MNLEEIERVAQDCVLVALARPEGYEDVHPDLLIADACIHDSFEPEVIPQELLAKLLAVAKAAHAINESLAPVEFKKGMFAALRAALAELDGQPVGEKR